MAGRADPKLLSRMALLWPAGCFNTAHILLFSSHHRQLLWLHPAAEALTGTWSVPAMRALPIPGAKGRRRSAAFLKPLTLLMASVGKSLVKSLDDKWDQACLGLEGFRRGWSQQSVTVTKVGPFLNAEVRESPDPRMTGQSRYDMDLTSGPATCWEIGHRWGYAPASWQPRFRQVVRLIFLPPGSRVSPYNLLWPMKTELLGSMPASRYFPPPFDKVLDGGCSIRLGS